MPRIPLGKGAVSVVSESIDKLFDKLKRRFIGPSTQAKQIVFGKVPDYSLKGLYNYSSGQLGKAPSEQAFDSMSKIVEDFIDSHKLVAKAKIIQAINASIKDSDKNDFDFEKELKTQLYDIMGSTTESIKKIVHTEANGAKNLSSLEAIVQINNDDGITDPTVMWVCIHDDRLCPECERLHLLDDGVTPRLWKMSECINGYYKRGGDKPALLGLHPLDRCQIVTILPEYGFKDGRVTYIGKGHDEYQKQRG